MTFEEWLLTDEAQNYPGGRADLVAPLARAYKEANAPGRVYLLRRYKLARLHAESAFRKAVGA